MPKEKMPVKKDAVLNSDNVSQYIDNLRDELPASFTRQTASKALGGMIAPRTLANIDSAGDGPPRIQIGGRVGYERESFLQWLRQRVESK